MSRTPTPRPFASRSKGASIAGVIAAVLATSQLATVSPAAAEATYVNLGSAASFAILGGTGVANTGAGTVVWGNVGLSPTGTIVGFPPGTLNPTPPATATIHDKNATAVAAQTARAAAYTAAAGQTPDTTFAADQAGATFHPGVHRTIAAFANSGVMTLDADGDQSAVFIFQVDAAFSPAAASSVALIDGALANNVFWQVSGAVSLGAGAEMVGTILGAGAITFGAGASIKGRALSPGTVTMTNSPFTNPVDDFDPPIVTIDGGDTRSTNDTTPSISGTSDEPEGGDVTVTVAGQTLHTTIGAGGTWSVSAGALSPGPHTVVATSTDASQNVGTDDQVLTVDTTAPVVSINGGASRASNDTTPTISGTTDEPISTAIQVTVGAQTLNTTAGAGGAWSVDAATLTEATYLVSASVEDAASNSRTVYQALSIDLTVPVVGINGGATASTDDTTPYFIGTSAEPAGTTVTVTVDAQTLTTTVASGGTWERSAALLAVGTYQVVASITDAAGNTGTATQTLTITSDDPVDPDPVYRPDAAIRPPGGAYVGNGIYALSKQKVVKKLTGKAKSATFTIRMTNRGDTTDRVKVLGTVKKGVFKVKYLAGGVNVTSAVKAGTYLTRALLPGASTTLTMKVTKKKSAEPGDKRTFKVRATSLASPTVRDTVAAVVKLAK